MKVHEAMSAVMKSIGAVKKDAWNEHQKFKFRGIDDLHNACYGPLCQHGVVVLPEVIEAVYEDVKTSTGKPARQATLRVRYTFVGPEGDTLCVTSQGEAMDSADKATSKALAMAFKYALLQTFVLPTEGQDDGDHHTPERGSEAPQPQAPSFVVPSAESRQALVDQLGAAGIDEVQAKELCLLLSGGVHSTVADLDPQVFYALRNVAGWVGNDKMRTAYTPEGVLELQKPDGTVVDAVKVVESVTP